MMRKSVLRCLNKFMFGLLACCVLSCEDELDLAIQTVTGPPHDASRPIEITDFTPKEVTSGQQMVIYGKNFGSDPSLIRVNIGGSEAVVISSNGEAIYCLAPAKSASDDFQGFEDEDDDDDDEEYAAEKAEKAEGEDDTEVDARTIHVAVGAHGFYREASSQERIVYKRAWKVRTLAGKVNEKNEWDFRVSKTPLPFSDCGNFPRMDNFIIDPVNPNHLWGSCDNTGGIRLFDLEKQEVTFFCTGPDFGASTHRIRKIVFTHDENHDMIIATDFDTNTIPVIFHIKRNSPTATGVDAFKTNGVLNSTPLVASRNCNGLAIHPKTNSLFFSKWNTTEFIKFPNHKTHPELKGNKNGIFEFAKQGVVAQSTNPDHCEVQFGFGEGGYELAPAMHPTGRFMYAICINYSYISRTFYNENDDTFGLPVWYISSSPHAGFGGYAGYVDDIGMDAKVNHPREGVFVKNPAYAGQEDEYDFYFTERFNHCVRKVTPQGIVTTFAGRGVASALNNTTYGFADGLARGEAMFYEPFGIAYSEARNTFYIGDQENKRIREIYYD